MGETIPGSRGRERVELCLRELDGLFSVGRHMARAILKFIAAGLIVGMFAVSMACGVFAYRTWRRSVVKVHRGVAAAQAKRTPLSPDDKDTIYLLATCAILSGLGGAGLVVILFARPGRRNGRRLSGALHSPHGPRSPRHRP